MRLARLLVLFVYGESRPACPGAGGAFVLHARGGEGEIVRANGRRVAEHLLSITESVN